MTFNSKQYWIDRYALNHGTSGVGSYGKYATYKADVINEFLFQNNIETVFELGCGDGNQLSLLIAKKYFGYDISEFVIENNKRRFTDINYIFSSNINDFNSRKYDVTLSLDVIFHLIEDDVYQEYMKTLFALSDKYVIIYAPNEDKDFHNHCKYRNFTNDIPNNFKLEIKIENPLKGTDTQSDFFIYKKI